MHYKINHTFIVTTILLSVLIFVALLFIYKLAYVPHVMQKHKRQPKFKTWMLSMTTFVALILANVTCFVVDNFDEIKYKIQTRPYYLKNVSTDFYTFFDTLNLDTIYNFPTYCDKYFCDSTWLYFNVEADTNKVMQFLIMPFAFVVDKDSYYVYRCYLHDDGTLGFYSSTSFAQFEDFKNDNDISFEDIKQKIEFINNLDLETIMKEAKGERRYSQNGNFKISFSLFPTIFYYANRVSCIEKVDDHYICDPSVKVYRNGEFTTYDEEYRIDEEIIVMTFLEYIEVDVRPIPESLYYVIPIED